MSATNAGPPYAALSPASLDVMSMLEKQLGSSGGGLPEDNSQNKRETTPFDVDAFLNASFGVGAADMGLTPFVMSDRPFYASPPADMQQYQPLVSPVVLPQQQQQPQQPLAHSVNDFQSQINKGAEMPLTPEILSSFASQLAAAGLGKAEIQAFAAGQLGLMEQQQQNASHPAHHAFAHQSSAGGGAPRPTATMFPQPGIHTPEASGSSKDSASNISSPEEYQHSFRHGGQTRISNVGIQGSVSPGSRPNGAPEQDRQKSSSSVGSVDQGVSPASQRNTSSSSHPTPPQQASDTTGSKDHKRKAGGEELTGHQNMKRHVEDGDSGDEDGEDVKSGDKKNSSRRKGGVVKQEENDAQAKALKRKNQNRAAQKAFRERREQRVKDLEDRVAELEATNSGQSFENENLRQLLAKLQKENMSLKETNFTFGVPIPSRSSDTSNAASRSSTRQMPQQPPSTDVPSHRSSQSPLDANMGSTSVANSPLSYASSSKAGASSSSPSEQQQGTANTNQVFNPEPFNAFTGFAGSKPHPPFAAFGAAVPGPPTPGTAGIDLQALLNAYKAQQYEQGNNANTNEADQRQPTAPQFSAYREPNNHLASTTHAHPAGGDYTTTDPINLNNIFGDDETMNEFLKSLSQPEGDMTGSNDILGIAGAKNEPWSDHLYQPSGYTFSKDPTGTDPTTSAGPDSCSGASATMDPSSLSPGKLFSVTPPEQPSTADASPIVKVNELPGDAATGTNRSDHAPIDLHQLSKFAQETNRPVAVTKDGTYLNTQEVWESVHGILSVTNGFDLDDLCDSFKSKAQCGGNGPLIKTDDVDKIVQEFHRRQQSKKAMTDAATSSTSTST